LTKNSAPACVTERYDVFANGKRDFGTGGAVVRDPSAAVITGRRQQPDSCRHMLEGAIPWEKDVPAPQTEEEAGGPVCRSPVSLLGIESLRRDSHDRLLHH
jgi:hypothetical protein